MDHDDDVEHLFSWLQTPELRYREFAGAREITDAVITSQVRANSAEAEPVPSHNTQLEEEYPADQFPDQEDAPADIVVQQRPVVAPRAPLAPTPAAPATVTPSLTGASAPGPAAYAAGLFALGAGGRNTPRRPHYEEPVVPPPIIQTPAPRQAATIAAPIPTPPPPPRQPPPPPPAPPVTTAAPVTPRPVPPAAPPIAAPVAARPAVPANGGGLLGGAYRQNGFNGHGTESGAADHPAVDGQQRNEVSLDAVFGRLSGARERLPDPRDRMRHIRGLNPPPNRPR
jgi:hypothetical protein